MNIVRCYYESYSVFNAVQTEYNLQNDIRCKVSSEQSCTAVLNSIRQLNIA